MGIEYKSEFKQFHLSTNQTSYLLQVVGDGHLVHGYWGKRIHTPLLPNFTDLVEVCSFSPNPEEDNLAVSFDVMPREYPDYGRSDYQSPAIDVTLASGHRIIAPVYESHIIVDGKPEIEGLPSSYVLEASEASTLIITLRDQMTDMVIDLHYTVFNQYDAMTRHVVVRNEGSESIKLNKVLSTNVDFYQDHDFELMNLYGAWARERHISRIPIGRSSHVVDSKRGASSHEQNPFIALVRPDTTEDYGEVYAMNMVYSGSFTSEVSVNCYGGTRMQMGINPIDFSWQLEPGKEIPSPEVVMVYASEGLGQMSRIYHKLYRERLMKGHWQSKERPILINNWEATYFDFDEETIKSIIRESATLGMELFVLDDGWFGDRNSDKAGLGDWIVNMEKLPNGLQGLAKEANDLGMKFGLWFEPEMVNPDSDLYRKHPDWCLHVPGRFRSPARNQLILDLSRIEVQDYLIEAMGQILSSTNIEYVKWDMNRNMTEVGSAIIEGSRQLEVTHRYMLGLYRILETITSTYPNILFESCSGGGGRFDPAILHYMPQTWTSDDTDSYERLKIQWGTSMVYPPVAMAAHVSEVPNHQVHRITPLETRAHVAMAANFGFELNVAKMAVEDQRAVKDMIDRYKMVRRTVQYGDFYRLKSPYDGNGSSWMLKSEDDKQIIVYYYRHLAEPNNMEAKLKLKHLDPEAMYELEDGRVMHGDTMMHFGIRLPFMAGDFASTMIVMNRIG